MTSTILTREAAIRTAARLAEQGEDTRHLASEQTAYADEIRQVTSLVWDDGMDVEEAVAEVLSGSNLVCGYVVQHDASGKGYAWRKISATALTADVRQEIEAEILDGGNTDCDDYVASNGLHYRW